MPIPINTYNGRIVQISDEVYVITDDSILQKVNRKKTKNYTVGDKVRLISGIDRSEKLGYHFDPKWITVCSVHATEAEFVGFPKKAIKKCR